MRVKVYSFLNLCIYQTRFVETRFHPVYAPLLWTEQSYQETPYSSGELAACITTYNRRGDPNDDEDFDDSIRWVRECIYRLEDV